MDPLSALAIAGTASSIIADITQQILKIREIIQQIQGANLQVLSLLAQLNTMKAALGQIDVLIQTAEYDHQLQMDLGLSLQASQLHMAFLDEKMSKLKLKKAGGSLKFGSKVKVVFESKSMGECLCRLDHQATALNLLISVLTSRSLTEQKSMLQRSNTRKVFKQVEDDTASIQVLREDESRPVNQRTLSEPPISNNPWKRFTFDRQLVNSKTYDKSFGRLLRRRVSDKDPVSEVVTQFSSDEEDGTTLVEELEPCRKLDTETPEAPESTVASQPCSAPPPGLKPNPNGKPHFSRVLAFGHAESKIPDLINRARDLWASSNETRVLGGPPRNSAIDTFQLSTRFFDASVHYCDIHQNRRINEEMLASYKDVSTVLFAVTPAAYCGDGADRLAADLELFGRIANDYHLWLAKLVLFIDTTELRQNLSDSPAQACFTGGYAGTLDSAVEDIRSRFLQAGGIGASIDRIHVHVGEPDDAAAGAVFAVTNHANQMQSNKWSGLSKIPTV